MGQHSALACCRIHELVWMISMLCRGGGQENRGGRVRELESQLEGVRSHYHHRLRSLENQLQVLLWYLISMPTAPWSAMCVIPESNWRWWTRCSKSCRTIHRRASDSETPVSTTVKKAVLELGMREKVGLCCMVECIRVPGGGLQLQLPHTGPLCSLVLDIHSCPCLMSHIWLHIQTVRSRIACTLAATFAVESLALMFGPNKSNNIFGPDARALLAVVA